MPNFLFRLGRFRALLVLGGGALTACATIVGAADTLISAAKSFYCHFTICELARNSSHSGERKTGDPSPEQHASPKIHVSPEVIIQSKIITRPTVVVDSTKNCSEHPGFYVFRKGSYISVENDDTIFVGDILFIYIVSQGLIVSPVFNLKFGAYNSETAVSTDQFERLPMDALPSSIEESCGARVSGKPVFVKRARIPITRELVNREFSLEYEAEDLYEVHPINIRVE